MKNQYIGGGGLPKKEEGGVLGQFVDLRGAWPERGGGVFEGGLIPQCPLCCGASKSLMKALKAFIKPF